MDEKQVNGSCRYCGKEFGEQLLPSAKGRRKYCSNEPANLEIWLNGHPAGQRLQDIYKKDVERLALENYNLKQQLNHQTTG